MDFAIRLVIFVLNLPDKQVQFWGEIQIAEANQKAIKTQSKRVLGLVEMAYGILHVSYSLSKWQAEKLTFLPPAYFAN